MGFSRQGVCVAKEALLQMTDLYITISLCHENVPFEIGKFIVIYRTRFICTASLSLCQLDVPWNQNKKECHPHPVKLSVGNAETRSTVSTTSKLQILYSSL